MRLSFILAAVLTVFTPISAGATEGSQWITNPTKEIPEKREQFFGAVKVENRDVLLGEYHVDIGLLMSNMWLNSLPLRENFTGEKATYYAMAIAFQQKYNCVQMMPNGIVLWQDLIRCGETGYDYLDPQEVEIAMQQLGMSEPPVHVKATKSPAESEADDRYRPVALFTLTSDKRVMVGSLDSRKMPAWDASSEEIDAYVAALQNAPEEVYLRSVGNK